MGFVLCIATISWAHSRDISLAFTTKYVGETTVPRVQSFANFLLCKWASVLYLTLNNLGITGYDLTSKHDCVRAPRVNMLVFLHNTVCLQMNGAVSKVKKKCISHLTRAKPTPSAAATVQVSSALPVVRFSCLLRGQFPRWRRSRKRLSVCSVLRCPDLWLQCSVSFVQHGLS